MATENNYSLSTDKNHLKNQPDEELFLALKEGDHASHAASSARYALEIIYDRYGLLVYRLIYRMLKNAQEAEDLTQEIFINLQQRGNYNPEKASFYTYLMVLTRSRTIDKIRSQRSKWKFLQNVGKIKDLIASQNSSNPMETISIDERAIQVREALKNLSQNQREVLELSYYEGLSQSEIAEKLNIPLGTVKTHSRRGLIKLRQNLQNLFN